MATQVMARESEVEIQKQPVIWWQTSRAKTVGLTVLAVIAITAVVWWCWFFPYVSTDDAKVAATLVRLAPSGIGGRIVSLNVDVGSHVKKGDLLLEIDHRVAQADLQRAQAQSTLAQRNLVRVQQLVSQRSLPPRDLDQAEATAQSTDAAVKLAQVNLENTYLRAPYDGIVVQKSAVVGNMLEPGQTALTIADVQHAWIAADVEETEVGLLRLGQPVTITVDEGMTLKGHVMEIDSATASQFALIPSDNGSGNFTKVVQRIPIKVAVDSVPARPLRVGESVELRIKVR